MGRFAKWIGGLVIVAVVAMLVGLGPVTHSAQPITARVVDAETGEPIAGASVATIYWIYVGIVNSFRQAFAVQETRTTADGTFHLPGFGPKLRWPPWGRLSGEAPQVVVFKPGYEMFAHENTFPIEGPGLAGWVVRSQADGYVFRLVSVGPDAKEQSAEERRQCDFIESLYWHYCACERVPQLYSALVNDDRLRGTGSCALARLKAWNRCRPLGLEGGV